MHVMGRRVPDDNLSLIHPFLYLSLLVVGLAASIAIITALCSVRFRKKSSSSEPLETAKDSDAPSTMDATAKSTEQPQTSETENDDTQMKELPLPPAMQQPKEPFNPPRNIKRATSERRASFSLSLKVPRSLSMAKYGDHFEDNKKGKMKTEDSVWMKTIILGEKCVPDEEDPVIYEGKGKKISAYHPKNSSSISISRQSSFIDPDALSVHQTQKQEQKIYNI